MYFKKTNLIFHDCNACSLLRNHSQIRLQKADTKPETTACFGTQGKHVQSGKCICSGVFLT